MDVAASVDAAASVVLADVPEDPEGDPDVVAEAERLLLLLPYCDNNDVDDDNNVRDNDGGTHGDIVRK